MTAVSTEDRKAASTGIGNFFLTDVYTQSLKTMMDAHERHFFHWAPKWFNDPTRPAFVWEMRAIGIGGHRQSGKTETIVRLVWRGDVVISYNTYQRAELERRLVTAYGPDHGVILLTGRGLQRHIREKKENHIGRPARVWIDDAKWVFQKILDPDQFAVWLSSQFLDDIMKTPLVVKIG